MHEICRQEAKEMNPRNKSNTIINRRHLNIEDGPFSGQLLKKKFKKSEALTVLLYRSNLTKLFDSFIYSSLYKSCFFFLLPFSLENA